MCTEKKKKCFYTIGCDNFESQSMRVKYGLGLGVKLLMNLVNFMQEVGSEREI